MAQQGEASGISVESVVKLIHADIRAQGDRLTALTGQQNKLATAVYGLTGLKTSFEQHEQQDDARHAEIMKWQRKAMMYAIIAVVAGVSFGAGYGIIHINPESILKLLAQGEK